MLDTSTYETRQMFSMDVEVGDFTSNTATDVAARFSKPPVAGPMRSFHSELAARAIAKLLTLDPDTTVKAPRPVTPIDPISLRPVYAETMHSVHLTTGVPKDQLFDVFRSTEQEIDKYDEDERI